MVTLEPIPTLADDDPLARFILSRHHFAATKNRVKPEAFLPPPDGIATSVFTIRSLPEAAVWELAQACVAMPGRTVHARADVRVRDVTDVSLEVVLDNTPPRHANIAGWPAEKSARKLRAEELAARATLKLAPAAVSGSLPPGSS
jgi:hypothetical protein